MPVKGNWRAAEDAWSNVVEVEVARRPPGPADRVATATARGRLRGWAAVPGATSYAVQWRQAGRSGAWLGAVSVSGTRPPSPGSQQSGLCLPRPVRARRARWPPQASSAATVPALAVVTGARVTHAARALKARARPVAFATSYTLEAAGAPSCRGAPAQEVRGRRGRLTTTVRGSGSPDARYGCARSPHVETWSVTWPRPPRRASGCATDPHVRTHEDPAALAAGSSWLR